MVFDPEGGRVCLVQSGEGVVKVDFETPEKGTRDLLYVDGDMQISIDHRGFIAVAVRNK